MTTIEPDLIFDIEPDLERGEFKFIEDTPCKFYDETNKKCKIYDLRPSVCKTHPVSGGGIVGAGDCEYMVRYVFEKCKNILVKCL
ncbi:MAG: YkgJ family cysteine cluster protein [Methanobacteriaceae archaeon]|nr:YkgJ family cysteine cluster protein [Methanobacteriaceae archaeon]